MDRLLWLILLWFLISLIIIFSVWLCYGICIDLCWSNRKKVDNDIEDLTGSDGKFRHDKFISQVVVRSRRGSLLQDIHQDSATFIHAYSIENIMSDLHNDQRRGSAHNSKFNLVTEGMRKNSLASISQKFSLKAEPTHIDDNESVDSLDPHVRDNLRKIDEVEDEACKIDYEINYFLGGERNLKFFTINEKLIRLSLALGEVDCTDERLRKRKRDVLTYINKCKEKLNNKVS